MKIVLDILNRSLALGTRSEIVVHNHPYPSLTVQTIGTGPRALPAIAVFQHHLRGAKLLRHPEMRFEVDLRCGEACDLLPFCWRSDYAEIEEYSVVRDGFEPDGRPLFHVDPARLSDQRFTALEWDRLLTLQGFTLAYSQAWLLGAPFRIAHA